MKLKFGIIVGAALAVSLAVPAAPVLSQSGGDAIKARKALMKDNSRAFRAIAAYVKKGKGSPADVNAQARTLAAAAAKIPGLFPKGTSLSDGAGKTRAKPAIWSDRAKFDASAANFGKLAMNLSAAAQSGDKKAIAAAFGSVGKGACGACHRAYRGPKQK